MFIRGFASAASLPKRQTALYSSQPHTSKDARLANFRDKNLPRDAPNLDELWEAFSALRNEEEMEYLDGRELFGFAGMIMRSTGSKDPVMTNPIEWGERLQCIVDQLTRKSHSFAPTDSVQLRCLSIVALALQGLSDQAASEFVAASQTEPSCVNHPRWILDTSKHVLRSFLRQDSPSRAIDFYLDNYFLLRFIDCLRC